MFRSHLLAIAALGAPVLLAAQGADRGAFVARLGSDTLAVERYSRTGNKFESDIAARIPMTRRLHYTGTLNPDGTFSKLHITATPVSKGAGQLPPLDATLVFGKDSAVTTLTLPESTQVIRAPLKPGAMPVTTFSWALYEMIALRARRTGGDSVPVPVIGLGAQQTVESYVVRRGPDAVDIGYFGSPMHLKLDRSGRVVRVDGSATTDLTILVDLGTWFRDAGGNLLDPSTVNGQTVADNIARGFDAFEDENHDGSDDHGGDTNGGDDQGGDDNGSGGHGADDGAAGI